MHCSVMELRVACRVASKNFTLNENSCAGQLGRPRFVIAFTTDGRSTLKWRSSARAPAWTFPRSPLANLSCSTTIQSNQCSAGFALDRVASTNDVADCKKGPSYRLYTFRSAISHLAIIDVVHGPRVQSKSASVGCQCLQSFKSFSTMLYGEVSNL